MRSINGGEKKSLSRASKQTSRDSGFEFKQTDMYGLESDRVSQWIQYNKSAHQVKTELEVQANSVVFKRMYQLNG